MFYTYSRFEQVMGMDLYPGIIIFTILVGAFLLYITMYAVLL
jgi:hypothetical protein